MKKLSKSIRSKAVWTKIGTIKWKITFFFFFFRIVGAVCEIFCVLKISLSDKRSVSTEKFQPILFVLHACAKYFVFEGTTWKNTTSLLGLAQRHSLPDRAHEKLWGETRISQDPMAGWVVSCLLGYNATCRSVCAWGCFIFRIYPLQHLASSF